MTEEFIWNVKNGDVDNVKDFIEKGGNVNEQKDGRYPIHYAADYGHKDVIEILAGKGAKIDVEDKHGITPLLNAIYEGHAECVELLIRLGASKQGKAPDGSSYIQCAEKTEIKDLLK